MSQKATGWLLQPAIEGMGQQGEMLDKPANKTKEEPLTG